MSERYFPTSYFPGSVTKEGTLGEPKRITKRAFLRLSLGTIGAYAAYEAAKTLGKLFPHEAVLPKKKALEPSQIAPPIPQAQEAVTKEIVLLSEISARLETNQLAVYQQLEDLPGFIDKREEVTALLGSPKEREQAIDSIIWHWTWTDPGGENGVGIDRLKDSPCYHFCILPENVDGVFAQFQYLTAINSIANHAYGHNETTVGISYIGKGAPTQQQERTRRLLTLWLMENLGISPENVKVHREVGKTEDFAGVRGLNRGSPDWQEGAKWERRKLASIQRGLHPERWASKDENGKWVIPELTDNALSIQEAAVVARMVAENWGIPIDEVFMPHISSESNFRQWEVDGSVVMDYQGGEGTGIGQIVPRWHPEVDLERMKSDAGYNLNESARILLDQSGNWEEKVLHYKGDVQRFLDYFRQVRDSFPAIDRETGLREWCWQLPKPKVIESGPSDRNIIALTFDGGFADPQGKETLRVLREHQVKSSIFLTGKYIQAGSELVGEMLKDGHEISNHSFEHPDFSDLDESQIENELERTAEVYQALTGDEMSVWFRFPYGSSNQEAVQAVSNNGYQAVQWTLASRDWENIPSERIFNDIVDKAHPGAIVVLHLGGKNTAAALEKIIPELRNRGYQLVTLSEMFMRG